MNLKKFENFQKPDDNLQTLIEILETELEDDFGFGACRWWKKVGDASGYFRENSKDIFPIPEYDNDTIIVEIENSHLYRFTNYHLKEFSSEINKYTKYSSFNKVPSKNSGYLILSTENIDKNPFFQRIFNITNYKIKSIFYDSGNNNIDIITLQFEFDKQ